MVIVGDGAGFRVVRAGQTAEAVVDEGAALGGLRYAREFIQDILGIGGRFCPRFDDRRQAADPIVFRLPRYARRVGEGDVLIQLRCYGLRPVRCLDAADRHGLYTFTTLPSPS